MQPRQIGFPTRCAGKESSRHKRGSRGPSQIERGSRFILVRNPADGLSFILSKTDLQRRRWGGRSTTAILVVRNAERYGTIAMLSPCGGDERVTPSAAGRVTGPRATACEDRVCSYEFLDTSPGTNANAIARPYGSVPQPGPANSHEHKVGGGKKRRADKQAIRRSHGARGDPARSLKFNGTFVKVVGAVRLFGELAAPRNCLPKRCRKDTYKVGHFSFKTLKVCKKMCVYGSFIHCILPSRELSFP